MHPYCNWSLRLAGSNCSSYRHAQGLRFFAWHYIQCCKEPEALRAYRATLPTSNSLIIVNIIIIAKFQARRKASPSGNRPDRSTPMMHRVEAKEDVICMYLSVRPYDDSIYPCMGAGLETELEKSANNFHYIYLTYPTSPSSCSYSYRELDCLPQA